MTIDLMTSISMPLNKPLMVKPTDVGGFVVYYTTNPVEKDWQKANVVLSIPPSNLAGVLMVESE